MPRTRQFMISSSAVICLAGVITLASLEKDQFRARNGDASSTPLSRPRTVSTTSRQLPDLGPGVSLHGKQLFPPDNAWNQDISNAPVDPNSANLIASIGNNDQLHPDFGTFWRGVPNGIPYTVVAGTQPLVTITFTAWGAESDPGPYPVPRNAPIEGGPNNPNSDNHVIVID